MLNLYFISGLGADEKAFARIKLNHVNVIHIPWIAPKKKESLHSYVKRFSKTIDTKQPFIIIALSFGGIIAHELNKMISPQRTILISSVTHHKQFPAFYQLGKHVIPLLPHSFFKQTNFFINYLFGAKGKNKQVLDKIFKANDPSFVKWCVLQLLDWRQTTTIENLISIHGTNDKIIPFHPCNYSIDKGSHFMVYTKASQIQKILQKEIDCILV